MDKAIFWDFDGVVVDSIDECLVTSYNAFAKIKGRPDKPAHDPREVPLSFRKGFYKLRKHVRPAGEYFVIFESVLQKREISSYAKFKIWLKKNSGMVRNFQKEFYSARSALRKKFPDDWYAMHRGYPGLKEKWDRLKKRFDFYIVSNKDSDSISAILKYLDLAIDRKNIFGSDFCLKKSAIIAHILKNNDLDARDVFFIDDNYRHLLEAVDTGMRLFFATWGYGEMPGKINKKITPLKLNDFDGYLLRRG